METKEFFKVRLDEETSDCLAKLAKVTNRKKADAARIAIKIASRLFSDEQAINLGKQGDKGAA